MALKRSLQKSPQAVKLGRGAFNCVAWSSDRLWLALGGDDNAVYVFTPKGELHWRRKKHTAPVESLAWSPDGRCLASGADDGTVRLWSFDGTELRCLDGHEGIVAGIAWAPDSRRLVSGSEDRTLRLWSAADGAELRRIEGHEGAVWSVAWSPDGRVLASGAGDRTVRLWSALSGGELRCLTGHTNQVSSVVWSPDSRRLASGGRDQTVRLWSVQDGTELNCLEGSDGAILSMAWSPEGQCLALGSSQGVIRLWSPDDEGDAGASTVCPRASEEGRKTVPRPNGYAERVWGVAWSPDGSHLAAVARDGTLAMWEVAAPLPPVSTTEVNDAVQWLARQAATMGRRAPPWIPHLPGADAVSGLGVLRVEGLQRSGAPCIALHPNGRRLASAHSDGHLRCWNLMDGQLFWTSIDPATENLTKPSDRTQPVIQDLAWSPDGRSIAVGMENGAISLWSAADGVELHRLTGHRAPVSSVAWSPDGDRLASGSADRTVRLWSVEGGVELRCLRGHTDLVRAIVWSPNGRYLASGAQDCTVRLWSVTDGRELRCLKGHTALVYSVAWSPDGRRLVSGSQDQTVRLWSITDGAEQQRLEGHSSAVLSVAWSPDAIHLASGSVDGVVCVWNSLDAGGRGRSPLRSFLASGYTWRVAWAPGGSFLISSHAEDVIHLWNTLDLLPGQTTGQAPTSANLFRPVDLSSLPAALVALHRLGIHPPLSLVHDLRTLLGGGAPPALEPLFTGPEGERIQDLQTLGWSSAARTGLLALLLHGLPDSRWEVPSDLTPGILRTSLAAALAGESIDPDAPPPPLAFLRQTAASLDAPLLTLIAALGPDAVAADPGLLLRLRYCVTQLPGLNPVQRHLLRQHLIPLGIVKTDTRNMVGGSCVSSGVYGQNGGNFYREMSVAPSGFPIDRMRFPPGESSFLLGPDVGFGRCRRDSEWRLARQYCLQLPPRMEGNFALRPCLRPTVIILDCSPACHGAVEGLLRPAAHALAATLRRQRLPVVLVSAGGRPTVHLLEQPADLLTFLTQRSQNPPDPVTTLAVATALRRQLVGNTREPIILLLTQPQWGGEIGEMVLSSPHLRALFVQDVALACPVAAPVWSRYCERWEALTSDQHTSLPEVLGRLIG
ncbi:hypothetical protein CCP3SC1_440024 [Gammaproteobacteria bacterium]